MAPDIEPQGTAPFISRDQPADPLSVDMAQFAALVTLAVELSKALEALLSLIEDVRKHR